MVDSPVQNPDRAEHLVASVSGACPASMKTLGMLTGLSYVSGLDYYRGLNERIAKLMPRGRCMERNSEMVIVSLDCDEYVHLLESHDADGVREYLFRGVKKLDAAGIDFLVIASNTAHICHDLIRARIPKLPILHIADCVAAAAKGAGSLSLGLLGTEPTMRDGSWLKQRLAAHGVKVVTPSSADDQRRCYDIIKQELSFNIFREESRQFFVDLARKLYHEEGATGGVILGCTEIELLVRKVDADDVPFFRSAELHMDAAARVQAGIADLEDFLPPLCADAQPRSVVESHVSGR
ncbi:unnamed protein product [Polarella glacialis]|uniref:Aspartate racemase n=1 Tax=Polarella glacialis TaxID=89957 RepID=A0A813FFL5_POLGL|nr:unnamed protein product [Polarella glacialis]